MVTLKRLISWRGIKRRPAKGQIATYLMLLMIVVLIMGMFLTNLGQLSTNVVGVANAADSASLFLGSQLATKANGLCAQLNQDDIGTCPQGSTPPRFCKRTGWLGTFLALLVVVVAFALPGAQPLLAWQLGLVAAGANAAGSAIAIREWRAVVLGAANGFSIGFGIATGANMFQHGVKGFGLAKDAAMLNKLNPTITTVSSAGMSATSAAMHATIGAAIVTSLPISSYVGGTDRQISARKAEGIADFSKDLNAEVVENPAAKVDRAAITQSLSDLPEYERMRETTLLEALSAIVDDPNMTVGPSGGAGCFFPGQYGPAAGDPFDADGDGDKAESISCLNYWWSERVRALTAGAGVRQALVTSFMEGPANFVPAAPGEGQSLRTRLQMARNAMPFLERNEVECECLGGSPIPSEGPTVELFRTLDKKGYPTPFWKPGPSQSQVRSFYDDLCKPSCAGPPPNWDSIDAVKMQYEEFILKASALVYNPVAQGPMGYSSQAEWYKHLANTTEEWLPKLYNPNATTDAYDQLNLISGTANGWFLTMRDDLVPSLPTCNLSYGAYPQVYSERDFSPACANETLVDDPKTGIPQDTNPIYGCTHVNGSSPSSNLATGIHLANFDFDPNFTKTFPGPVCKIDGPHKADLLQQLTTVRNFVQPLQGYIPANYSTHFDNPLPVCPPPPPPPALSCSSEGSSCGSNGDCCSDDCDQSLNPTTGKQVEKCRGPDPAPPTSSSELVTPPDQMLLVSIDEVALAKWPTGSPDRVDYTYTFEYQCRNCVTYKGATNCGAPYPVREQRSKSYPDTGSLGAPDVQIPAQSGLTAQQNFLNIADQFHTFVSGIRITKGFFGTTDADIGGAYNPTDPKETEFSDGAGGYLFITMMEPFLWNAEENRWVGTSSIPFFLENLKQFSENIQNAVDVQPAKDGRLPNPLQLINDPIRGGAHPVDGRYEWQDSRGPHVVTVETGPFIKASTIETEEGNFLMGKKCTEMIDYCDNTPGCPYRGPDRTWVRVTRKDPTDQDLGLWRWNPFAGTIRKAARATYSHISVGMCGTSGGDCP